MSVDTDFEHRLTSMLHDRADAAMLDVAIDVPLVASATPVTEFSLSEPMVRVVEVPTSRRRSGVLIAAAVLLVATYVALFQHRAIDSVANGPSAPSSHRFETLRVLLTAGSVNVTVAGHTFAPTGDLLVGGDPGILNQSTELDLIWHQGNIQQRIDIDFASDGTNWWANEIRTYDGSQDRRWIDHQGEFFKSPLGSAYVGDLNLPNLKIHDMHLEAFRRPSSCVNPTAPLAVVANFPKIDAVVGLFGANLSVVDTNTCAPVPVQAFNFEYRVDDPAVVAVVSGARPDDPPLMARVDLDLATPGNTTIHAVARDQTGKIVGTADMHVVVRPIDSAGTPSPPTTVPAGSTVP